MAGKFTEVDPTQVRTKIFILLRRREFFCEPQIVARATNFSLLKLIISITDGTESCRFGHFSRSVDPTGQISTSEHLRIFAMKAAHILFHFFIKS